MVNLKLIEIGDTSYWMRCSLLTVEAYENETGKRFSKVITNYQKLGNNLEGKSDEESAAILVESILDVEMDAINLAYCMIKEAQRFGKNEDFSMTREEFVSQVGSLNSAELKGVLQLAMSLFPRGVQKQTGRDEEKR